MIDCHVQLLESRRLFSGGIDPSFGSSTGAVFVPPANATVVDSTVDSAGRVILVGAVKVGQDSDGNAEDQMFIARLNSAGQLDSSFFGGGINQGTPRGITQLTHVIALAEGGYIASGLTAGGNVLVRFTAAGRVDSSYGQNGVHKTSLDVEAILERSDHSLIIVGDGFNHPVIDEDNDADAGNYAMHITQMGGVDTLYGGNGNGYAFLGDETWGDDFTEVDNNVNSTALDSAGRLVLGLNTNIATFPDGDSDANAGETAVSLSRFNTDGSPDPTFIADQEVDTHLFYQTKVDHHALSSQFPPDIDGLIVTRPDGKAVALSRDDQASTQAPRLTLVNASANADRSKVTIDLSKLSTKFAVPNLAYHDMLALPDNSILIAGATLSGSTYTPAIIKLKPDLSVDTSFGTSGILKFGKSGKDESAGSLQAGPDGTVYAVSGSDSISGGRRGNIAAARIFVDDKPVVQLLKAKPFNGTERITVTINGTHPIDTSSLDDNDLRLTSVGTGAVKKLRLLRFSTASNGTVTAIYRISSSLLTKDSYTLNTVAGQILNTNHDADVAQMLGQVRV